MKENYGALLAASFVYMVISVALSFIPILGGLASLIISGPLMAGWYYMGVRAVRGRTEFGDLFLGFRKFGETLGIYWLLVLIMLGASIPVFIGLAAAFATDGEGAGVAALVTGGVISFVLWIYFGVRLSLAWQVCMDTDLGITESLGRSWNITRPYFGALIGLWICVTLIYVGLIIMCVLPVIFLGMPLIVAVTGAAYCLIVADTASEEQVFA
jgi:hypothetical protein